MIEQTEQPSEQTQIDHGEAVRMFLQSEAGIAVLGRTHRRIFDEWKDGTTLEAREQAHKKFSALESLCLEMRATVENGAVLKTQRAQKEARAKINR